jgi:PIN domain nuclease of toxin-antitoxin system
VAGYLIDSHIFLWAVESPENLSEPEQMLLMDSRLDVVVSVASIWELSIKAGKGHLAVPGRMQPISPDHFERAAATLGLPILPVIAREAEYVRRLPPIHRDPFDRLLIAQSLLSGRTMVTRDAVLSRYPGVQIFEP